MPVTSRPQQGYILLALLLILFVSGSSFMLSAVSTTQSVALREQAEVARQLAEAKAALLAYAANTPGLYADAIGPGYLPCPDADNSGLPDAAVGDEDDPDALCPSGLQLGRLPEEVVTDAGKFPLNSYYAGRDQQFWYAVSPLHLRTSTNTASGNKTNSALTRLTLDSTAGIAALIIAPGAELPTQDRQANPLLYSNYLDGTNGSSSTNFKSQYVENPELFNDQVVAITHNELMQHVGMAAAARLQKELDADYAANGNDYPNCLIYNWYGELYYICPYVRSLFFNAWNGGWISAEQWNAYSGTYSYAGNTYYNLSRTLFNRTPSLYWPNPYVRFYGCSNMTFILTYGQGVRRQGDTC
jgi:hypothetical protein